MILGTHDEDQVRIHLPKLLTTRALVCSSSGGGKSWLIRRMLEQTHGKVQQIVIDPEGEYYTLRAKYPYILARKGGDCPVEVRSAELLTKRILELGVSAIVDLYDLSIADRKRFVRLFCETLIDAPKSLWHNALVVIDECHRMAPEKGHGEAESTEAVGLLMSQGRKRGFAGILSTQRISKLSKDVAAEAGNLMIGRTTLDVDVKRAGDLLGFDHRERFTLLRSLKPGQFYAFGPAISDDVVPVNVGGVHTAHPKVGRRQAPQPPPRGQIKAILRQLRDLPAEAVKKAQTVAELKHEIARWAAEVSSLKAKLRATEGKVQLDPQVQGKQWAHAQNVAFDSADKQARARWAPFDMALDELFAIEKKLAKAARDMKLPFDRRPVKITSRKEALKHGRQALAPKTYREGFRDLAGDGRLKPDQEKRFIDKVLEGGPVEVTEGKSALKKGPRAILECVASNPCTSEAITITTGYKRSTRDTYLARLVANGLVWKLSTGEWEPTKDGMAALGSDFKPAPRDPYKLREYWLNRLPEGESRILSLLLARPSGLTSREEISEHTGYKRSTRDTYISRLAARKLVRVTRGGVEPASLFFE